MTVTAKDLHGVMAMMPAFATPDASDITATSTVDVENLADGVDRIIKDGVDVLTTTGSSGECYNLLFDEFKELAAATVETAKHRVPVMIGATSPNPREVVQKLKFVEDIGGDGTLLGLPYYSNQTADYIYEFYRQIGELFPNLAIMIYHNPENHKTTIPTAVFNRLVTIPNLVGMKDSHRDTRNWIRLQRIIKGKISVFVNQVMLYPYARMGAAGCWSTSAWMGPWPVVHLRDLIDEGRDEEAEDLIVELMAAAGSVRESDERTGKLPVKLAGYVDPGANRTPVVELTDKGVESAQKDADRWKALCDKYRPIVEARAARK
jgi:trans-o-hydroxybenzylidenepyruvate hydratase-aldolase